MLNLLFYKLEYHFGTVLYVLECLVLYTGVTSALWWHWSLLLHCGCWSRSCLWWLLTWRLEPDDHHTPHHTPIPSSELGAANPPANFVYSVDRVIVKVGCCVWVPKSLWGFRYANHSAKFWPFYLISDRVLLHPHNQEEAPCEHLYTWSVGGVGADVVWWPRSGQGRVSGEGSRARSPAQRELVRGVRGSHAPRHAPRPEPGVRDQGRQAHWQGLLHRGGGASCKQAEVRTNIFTLASYL